MWTKISDYNINHHWECPDPECNEVADVAPGWYGCNGTPMCVECDQDMSYKYTEMKDG
jgi:hypothetical protein